MKKKCLPLWYISNNLHIKAFIKLAKVGNDSSYDNLKKIIEGYFKTMLYKNRFITSTFRITRALFPLNQTCIKNLAKLTKVSFQCKLKHFNI